ncbi:MAG: hypothetical protein ABIT09_06650 [Croceibacterium sp.]
MADPALRVLTREDILNSEYGMTEVTLADGRTLKLVASIGGMIDAESAYGKPLPKMAADASAGFIGAVRAMLWGSLRAHHPDISIGDTADLLQTDGEAVGKALADAIEAGFGSETAKPAPAKKRAA